MPGSRRHPDRNILRHDEPSLEDHPPWPPGAERYVEVLGSPQPSRAHQSMQDGTNKRRHGRKLSVQTH